MSRSERANALGKNLMRIHPNSEDGDEDAVASRPPFRRDLDLTLVRNFRRAVRLLSVAARFPAAAVTFEDADGQQQLVAQIGLEADQQERLLEYSRAASQRRGVHVIADSRQISMGATAAERDPFFAAIAIRVRDGTGVLSVMGPSRSAWNPASQATLIEVHAWVEETLEAIRSARVDHLTGLANRRDLEDVLEREWRRATRDATPISVVALDIDHFKAYNDAYGHPRGDEALRAVAEALRGTLKRPGDAIGRMGGEEFLACLPDTDAAGAQTAAEAMRRAVERLQIDHGRSSSGIVTVSVGCVTAHRAACIEGRMRMLVAAADRALYDAKACGRNQVVTIGLPEDGLPDAMPAPAASVIGRCRPA